jgi:alkylation response protein AidB-like acyl-CoA dehydrogenase
MGAVEKTIEYVNNREAFGSMLSSNQLIQGKQQSHVICSLLFKKAASNLHESRLRKAGTDDRHAIVHVSTC